MVGRSRICTHVPERKRNIMLCGVSVDRCEGGEDVHEGVREADFRAVDDPVADAFDQREEVMVAGVEYECRRGALDAL